MSYRHSMGDDLDDDRRNGRLRIERSNSPHRDTRHHPYSRPGPTAASQPVAVETPAGMVQVGRRVFVGNLAYKVGWKELKDHMKRAGDVLHVDILMDREGRSAGSGLVEFASAEAAAHAIRTLQDTDLLGRPIFLREDREDVELGGRGRVGRVQRSPPRTGYPGSAGSRPPPQPPLTPFATVAVPTDSRLLSRASAPVHHLPPAVDPETPFAGILEPYLYGQMYARYAEMMARGERGALAADYATALRTSSAHVGATAPPPLHISTPAMDGNRVLYISNLDYTVTWQTLKDFLRDRGFRDVRVELKESRGQPRGAAIAIFDDPREAASALAELQGLPLQGRTLDVKYDKFDGR
jgi:RNA recognition motif-containing protein